MLKNSYLQYMQFQTNHGLLFCYLLHSAHL
nr:MAG TPA: Protein of unknown function (DUF2370) [Caudoviricetes sp.]